MADLNFNQRSMPVQIVGAAEEKSAKVSDTEELKTNDSINEIINTTINVTITAVEGKVGALKLSERKFIKVNVLTVPIAPNAFLYYGYSESNTPFKIYKDMNIIESLSEGAEIWFKTASGSGSIAFAEGK